MSASMRVINHMLRIQDIAVLILAAGKGSRLVPLTSFIPKYSIPVSLHKKFISFVLKICSHSGYDIYLLIRNGKKQPVRKIDQYYGLYLSVLSSPYHRETGGEILNHYEFLARKNYKYLIILPSDYYIESFKLDDVIRYMERECLDVCIVGCQTRRNGEYIQLTNSGLIKKISDERTNFSAVGIYALTMAVLHTNQDLHQRSITSTELLNVLMDRGYKTKMLLYTGRWIDLGTWPRYLKFLIQFNLCSLWRRV